MYSVDNITKKAGKKVLVNAASLKLKAGRMLALVGPNGAGKSTLLKMMSGELAYDSGNVWLNNKALKAYHTRELSRHRAVLPQHTRVNFPFTVNQVLEIGRYAHQTTNRENEKAIEQAVNLTGLHPFLERVYSTLSGGEQQRVQMARVIAQISDEASHERYLLLDEPTASLDLAQQHSLLQLSRQLLGRQMGVMAVLHDLNLALQYADDILFLKQGRTIAYGPLDEVLSEEVIRETYNYPVKIRYEEERPFIVPVTPNRNQGFMTENPAPANSIQNAKSVYSTPPNV